MEIVIRQMKADEAQEVKKIGKRAFSWFEGLWLTTPGKALVAEKDGKIVGAVLYKLFETGGKKIGYVDYAFIDPDDHNQGIGNLLYQKSAEYLWEQGCDALTALVKDDNVGSFSLFQKNGFTRISVAELIRQFGIAGMLKHYFKTPFCIGIGMEYYAALRNQACPTRKEGNIKQLTAYVIANLIIFMPVILRRPQSIMAYLTAYLIFLTGGILAGYAGILFSRRKWHFRINNGGGLICALVSLGGTFPMVGNWYPDRYENTESFRRDMGINALAGWIFVLLMTMLTMFYESGQVLIQSISEIGFTFLLYRILAFYPFESFGGRRVYSWKKWIYVLMSFASVIIMILC